MCYLKWLFSYSFNSWYRIDRCGRSFVWLYPTLLFTKFHSHEKLNSLWSQKDTKRDQTLTWCLIDLQHQKKPFSTQLLCKGLGGLIIKQHARKGVRKYYEGWRSDKEGKSMWVWYLIERWETRVSFINV